MRQKRVKLASEMRLKMRGTPLGREHLLDDTEEFHSQEFTELSNPSVEGSLRNSDCAIGVHWCNSEVRNGLRELTAFAEH